MSHPSDRLDLHTLEQTLSAADPTAQVSLSVRSLSTQTTLDISLVRHPRDLADEHIRTEVLQILRSATAQYALERGFDEASTTFSLRIGINPDYWAHRIAASLPNSVRATYNQLSNRIGSKADVYDETGMHLGHLIWSRDALHLYTPKNARKKTPKPRAAAMLRDGGRYLIVTADQSKPESIIILPEIAK